MPNDETPNDSTPGEEIHVEVVPPAAAEEAGADAERIRKLEALLEESTSRAAQTAERLKDTHERYLRVAADFENWKKRASREREDTIKYGNERLLRDILPVVDNLERAVLAGSTGTTLVEGVRLVLKQLVEVLSRFGVKSFTSVGEPFDPAKHEALLQQEHDAPYGTILNEAAKGYMLHDRLLRPASVVVSKGRPTAEPPPPSEPSGGASA